MSQETSSTAFRNDITGSGISESFSMMEDVSSGSAESLNFFSGLLMLFVIVQIILVL